MTSSVRTGWRRANGSILRRSLVSSWVTPASVVIGPTRAWRAAKAVGRSSSAPRSRPTGCVLVDEVLDELDVSCCWGGAVIVLLLPSVSGRRLRSLQDRGQL